MKGKTFHMASTTFSAKERSASRAAAAAPLSKLEVAGAAVALFALCLLLPYSGDDWTWGGQAAFTRLNSGFANYNGRYLGNLLIIPLSRFYILRLATVYMMQRICRNLGLAFLPPTHEAGRA